VVRAPQIVLQFDKEGSTSTPSNAGDTNLTHRYLWGTGVDQILADEQVHYDWTPEDYITDALLWPLGDHLGSVRDAVDNSGTVRIHRAYDAYGNITSEELRNSGNRPVQPGQPGALEHHFVFTARPFDPDTHLQNNLHRWYDGTIGPRVKEKRMGFAGRDANVYCYCANSPLT
jgi:RHS repeat-associated protein